MLIKMEIESMQFEIFVEYKREREKATEENRRATEESRDGCKRGTEGNSESEG